MRGKPRDTAHVFIVSAAGHGPPFSGLLVMKNKGLVLMKYVN
jgi:hypothetical protein